MGVPAGSGALLFISFACFLFCVRAFYFLCVFLLFTRDF